MTDGSTAQDRWAWRWHVSQAGPREHYAAPRALQLTSHLAALYTGFWNSPDGGLLKRGLSLLKAYASQRHPDLSAGKVISFDAGMLAWRIHRAALARPKTLEQIMNWEVANSRWFDHRTLRALRRQPLDPSVDCFFGFQSECMETVQAMRDLGVFTIMDQASAGRIEEKLADEESRKWPGWATSSLLVPEPYHQRVHGEWQAASLILVNSEWSRQSIIRQGADANKIIVVPCVFEPEGKPSPPRSPHRGPLTILFLGRVTVTKGIQYFAEAAKLLKDSSHQFLVVGSLSISDAAVKSVSPNVRFLGRVARSQALEYFQKADLFVFPTLCDGFGMTQIEAMSQGVPVIATPNCGQVVTHGSDGLMVPAGDSRALADAITQLDQDRRLLAEMSRNAIEKSRQFNLRAYGECVNQAVTTRRA